ncbi:ATP-binding cassette domain-containing protein [Persicimonas caeni]|uniref:ATP-binding cassette domain-containing protein n=1 Tax=Persicimonas caeni TaxID=2292766 RepID=A0A4Y6PM80_PERCE|nr:ATP-binding cassette domain-containing protein [Persicimonas caeni]QDG49408.1 ATP-binding cassette domain-containing protein [Persicimonas caeni]QED30629.1 ATP-binding cassette domain-containing protein [Persicimonas caeni]
MNARLREAIWPTHRVDEALDSLGRHLGWVPDHAPRTQTFAAAEETDRNAWIGSIGERLGLDVEPCQTSVSEVGEALRRCVPALVRVPHVDGYSAGGYLAVVGTSVRGLRALTMRGSVVSVPVDAIADALVRPQVRDDIPVLQRALELTELSGAKVERLARVMAEEQHASDLLELGWLVRPALGQAPARHLRRHGVWGHLAQLLVAHGLGYAGVIGAWWILGQQALGGSIDAGWMWLWGLIVLALVPLRVMQIWAQGQLGVGVGLYLKRRLLLGLLRLDPDEVRERGSGSWLSRVIESESVEQSILGGAITAVTAVIELSMACFVLGAGAGGWPHASITIVWGLLLAAIGYAYAGRLKSWTRERLDLTRELVESLAGQRTRLVQEHPKRWHMREDNLLHAYLGASQSVDDGDLSLVAAGGRAWYAVALLALMPWLADAGIGALAVSVGGILLAGAAFRKLVSAGVSLIGFWVAWGEVRELFGAAARPQTQGLLEARVAAGSQARRADTPPTSLVARNLSFSYPGSRRPVLTGCSLELAEGNRWVMTGASGGGKSTLAKILAGLRRPDAGLLLWRGFDPSAVGEELWRRYVTLVPQFHDNHVMSAPLGFNLFMGGNWPPTHKEWARAQQICADLGLDAVIAKMPGGFQQMLGERGWQLSHGERSRLFVARALIQAPDILILDESFGTLDPATMRRALDALDRHARAVILIAHP